MDCRIGYVIVGVKALDPAVAFYRDTMGFEFLFSEPEFHFAQFKVGDMLFSLAEGAEETHGTGDRNTGIGFMVPDVDSAHAELAANHESSLPTGAAKYSLGSPSNSAARVFDGYRSLHRPGFCHWHRSKSL